MALTEQKRRYAEARLSGMPKKQAAISAGCPERTASQAASRLEKDREVQAAIWRLKVLESQNPGVTPDAPKGEPDAYIPAQAPDAVTFFFQVMNDLAADPKLRLDAAKAHAAYTVAKPGEMGKKEQRQEEAEKVSGGRFGLRKGNLRSVK
jgi:phage terminase small subunit